MKNPVELLSNPSAIATPRPIHWLTHSKLMAVVWTAMRIWLGVMWIKAGVAKLWGAENPGFMHHNGAGVAGFATHGVASYSWWASFLHSFVVPNSGWIGVFVSVTELLAGFGLVLGFLTPAAALGALILDMTYMLSGSAGVNPFYAMFAVIILATWRTSGWIGVDGLLGGYLQHRRELRQPAGVAGLVEHSRAA